MLLHINPTRQRGKRTGSLAGASGWYMTFFAAGVISNALASNFLDSGREAISQIPGERASGETLKWGRIYETRIGLPGQPSRRRPTGLV